MHTHGAQLKNRMDHGFAKELKYTNANNRKNIINQPWNSNGFGINKIDAKKDRSEKNMIAKSTSSITSIKYKKIFFSLHAIFI